jgi:hypothetical protein
LKFRTSRFDPVKTMPPKFELNTAPDTGSLFMERRRLRRIRMIVELTLNMITSDEAVSYREAKSLVECARKAILELHPVFGERYQRIVKPHFDLALARRWPLEDFATDDLVN